MQKREKQNLERETGFEPATLALARRCSTTELFPLSGAGGLILLRGQIPVKPITGAVLWVSFDLIGQGLTEKSSLFLPLRTGLLDPLAPEVQLRQ